MNDLEKKLPLRSIEITIFQCCFQFILRVFRIGMDGENNSSVVIKFAKPGPTAKLLDNEYRQYSLLDAEGNKNLIYSANDLKLRLDKIYQMTKRESLFVMLFVKSNHLRF